MFDWRFECAEVQLMSYPYTVYRPDGSEEKLRADWKTEPTYEDVMALLSPIFERDDEYFTHAIVWVGGDTDFVSSWGSRKIPGLADMFVSRILRPDQRGDDYALNEKATAIFRANGVNRYGVRPESLPRVLGTAVLFANQVWRF